MKSSSLKIFSMVFGVVYTAAFYMDWSVFRYFPGTHEFHWRPQQNLGPAILWYGWLVTATLASAAVALVVPRRLAERLSNEIVWLVPVAVVIVILIYERRWFL